MTTYIGYLTSSPSYIAEWQAKVRAGGPAVDEWATGRVLELRKTLPPGCKVHGTYVPRSSPSVLAAEGPGVMVVETEDDAHLAFISTQYTGLLGIVWRPATFVPGSSAGAEERLAANARESTGAS